MVIKRTKSDQLYKRDTIMPTQFKHSLKIRKDSNNTYTEKHSPGRNPASHKQTKEKSLS